jgi:hypothetical protein
MWCSFGVSLHGVIELLSCDGRIFLGHATHSQFSFKNRRAINAAIAPTTKNCSHPMSLQRAPSLQLQYCFFHEICRIGPNLFFHEQTRDAQDFDSCLESFGVFSEKISLHHSVVTPMISHGIISNVEE